MTIQVRDARIHIRHPGTSNADPPDIDIPGDDIKNFNLTERLRVQKAAGDVLINNHDGTYTLDGDGEVLPVEQRIHAGDRLDFYVALPGDFGFGSGDFGGAACGDYRLRATCVVRDVEYIYRSPSISYVGLSVEDFPGGILSMREVANAWDDIQVSGTSTSLVETLLSKYAPELDATHIREITETVSITSDRMNLFDLLRTIARRGGAVLYPMGDRVVFHNADEVGVADSTVIDEYDFAGHTYREDDIGMVNALRVDGSMSQAIDATNPADLVTTSEPYQESGGGNYAPDSYTTVDESTRVMFRVGTRKATIDRIELWTKTTGSGDSYIVRVQKDDGTGTAPINPDDESSDITNTQLGTDDELFLDDDGFTTFILPDHTLPEPRPWIIVETDGTGGQQIGIEADDSNPAYVNWYPYPLSVQQSNPTSQQVYRKRDGTVRRRNLQSLEEAQEVGNETIDHESIPLRVWTARADTIDAHEMRIGEGLSLTFKREAVDDDFIILERETEYTTGAGLHTGLSAQRLSDYKSLSEK